MGDKSKIEWTEATWNPVTGCTKISQGCKHCYAETMAKRLQAMGQARYRNGFALTLQPDALDQPLRWARPRVIFVNSMSDLFHKDVPLEYIQRVFAVMEQAKQHTFQVLTKRTDRVAMLAPSLPWPANVWMGVSVEDAAAVARVDHLRQVPAAVRFLSCEPLIGPLDGLDLAGIHWVIAGGESGAGARPMHDSWVTGLRDQCVAAGVPFFFKQWGAWKPICNMPEAEYEVLYLPAPARDPEATRRCKVETTLVWPNGETGHRGTGRPMQMFNLGKGRSGRELDGRTWDEMPARAEVAHG